MGVECAYSFHDLYIAAHGRDMTDQVYHTLCTSTQPERNAYVRQWAQRAHWQTEERRGTDGEMYTAFFPPEALCTSTGHSL